MKQYIIKLMVLFIMFLPINALAATVSDNVSELLVKIETLDNNIFLKNYPVGSIYITTASDESTVAKMASKYGGTWEIYGAGRMIVGYGSNGATNYSTINSIGGSSTSVINNPTSLPSHYHAYLTAPTITNSTTLESGHMPFGIARIVSINSDSWSLGKSWGNYGAIGYNGNIYGQNDYNSGGLGHSHSITLTESNTTYNGSDTPASFSVQNPYIVAYMYKRTA